MSTEQTRFKKEVSLEEQKTPKEDRFFRERQIASLIYEYFRVTWTNDSVENYADLFTVVFRNHDIQEFDSKWDEILLSMTKIPPDDILEGLYKLRIRASEKLKTVLELYDLEIHQKKLGPDYHRLKTMVERSIEQNLRNKIFGARNGNYEKNAVVKNQGTKQREQRSLGDRWQWKTNGQCSKGDNCSFRHDMDKRGKSSPSNPSPNSFMQQDERKASITRSPRGKSSSGRMSRWPCKDYLKGTCTNSFCEKWHPPECLFYKTKSGCRFGEKCSCAHRQVDEQPSKRLQKNGDKSAVAMLKKKLSSGHSHVASRPVSFPPHPIPEGMLSRSFGVPSRRDGPPSIWDTHAISGNVFGKSSRDFFSTLSAGIESMEFIERGAASFIHSGKE